MEGRTLYPQEASPFVMHLQRMSSTDLPPHQALFLQGPPPTCLDPSPVTGSQPSTAAPSSVLPQQQQQAHPPWMAPYGPQSAGGGAAGPVRIELSDAPPRLSLAGASAGFA